MPTSLPRAQTQTWDAFCQAQDARRSQSIAAAEALCAGDPGLACQLLAPWRFSRDDAACRRVVEGLEASPPQAPAAHVAATLGTPPGDGPGPAGSADQRQHLFTATATTPDGAVDHTTRVAWGLESLAWNGARIDREERSAWTQPVPTDKQRDAQVHALWSRFLEGDFWSGQDTVQKLLMPPAKRAFAAGLRARGVPGAMRGQYISEYAEAFFWTFLGGREGTPGWKDAAIRILEGTGDGPVDALGSHLDDEGWSWLVRCPTFSSPSWRATRRWALPRHPNALAETWRIQRDGPARPDLLEHLLDGQVALRLVASWADTDDTRTGPDRSWNVVLRHRSRTRGRLRALLLETASDRLLHLLTLPGLHARTAQAVAAQGWARACEVVHHHQLPAWDSSPTPTCEQPPRTIDDLPAVQLPLVRTWMLLALLRDRWAALEHWSHTGSWLKRPDSGWGRLLHDALPRILRDRDGGYDRLQAHLCLHWDDHVRTLEPVISAIATCRKGPEVRAAVEPYWEPEVPLPSRMGKSAIQAATRLLAPNGSP